MIRLATEFFAVAVRRGHGTSVSRRGGAAILFSEDFQDGRELEGVRFMNPFSDANHAVLDRILSG